jgi:hypothetical protein
VRVQRAVEGGGALAHAPAARATRRVTESIISLRAHGVRGRSRTYPRSRREKVPYGNLHFGRPVLVIFVCRRSLEKRFAAPLR